MRLLLAVLIFCLPAAAQAMSRADARHLMARTAFGPTLQGIEALTALSRRQAVEALLAEPGGIAATPAPDWVTDWQPPRPKSMDRAAREELGRLIRAQSIELKAWWMTEMVTGPAPLGEVMTLFWHNHFTSGLKKVRAPVLLFRQNQLLRRHALGNFAELLRAIARDPAMLLYLDGARNKASAPNENFARELFELFTLGEGHYSEQDVREAARAFTGWSLDRDTGRFKFRRFWHDGGVKEVLGRRGRLDGDDVIDLLLAHPRLAETIVEKLWKSFISERPDPAEVARLAQGFRASGYEIRPLMRELLTSPAFWAAENRGRLIKSPVDLIVGTVRLFRFPIKDPRILARASRHLGQDLFNPPNVKGWPGGTAWITNQSLMERQNLLARISGDDSRAVMATRDGAAPMKAESQRRAVFLNRWIERLPGRWSGAENLAALLAPLPPVDIIVLDREASAALVRHLLVDPVYQLK